MNIPEYVFHDYLFPFLGLLIAVFAFQIPTALVLLCARLMRGWRRWVAVALAIPLLVAGAADFYQFYRGGNLTGIVTFLIAPIPLVLVLALGVVDWIARRVVNATRVGATEPSTPSSAEDSSAV